jgi:peptidoglycan/LPS O-acetylase OafA/YrhL
MTDTTFTGAGADASTSASTPLPKSAVQQRLRNNNFDGLRLVFATMVLVFHVALLSEAPQLRMLVYYVSSTFAVQAFFVVSGFLVTMSFENTKHVTDYIRKRLLRIAPAYVAVVLVSAFLLSSMSSMSPWEYFHNAKWKSYVFYNLILSNFKNPDLPGVFSNNFETAVNGSLWTIKLEVMFYCAVPFIVWAVRRWGYRLVLGAIFILSVAWQMYFLHFSQMVDPDLAVRLARQLPGQLAFFGGGAFAYYQMREGMSPPPVWIAVIAVAGYAFAPGAFYTLVAPICVTLIVYWAAMGVPQLWNAHRTGDFSYGLYLYHFPIAQTLIALGVFTVAPVVGLLAVFALALLASVVSWHLIEKRALRLAHRRSAPRTISE